jgi:hypothetical protein
VRAGRPVTRLRRPVGTKEPRGDPPGPPRTSSSLVVVQHPPTALRQSSTGGVSAPTPLNNARPVNASGAAAAGALATLGPSLPREARAPTVRVAGPVAVDQQPLPHAKSRPSVVALPPMPSPPHSRFTSAMSCAMSGRGGGATVSPPPSTALARRCCRRMALVAQAAVSAHELFERSSAAHLFFPLLTFFGLVVFFNPKKRSTWLT